MSLHEYLGTIDNREDLARVAEILGVRLDWHEPDEQEVTAEVRGKSFDNAGFYGVKTEAEWLSRHGTDTGVEMYVRLFKEGQPVADVPLATLFAWATGYNDQGGMKPRLAKKDENRPAR
jgi:hypothetical protein